MILSTRVAYRCSHSRKAIVCTLGTSVPRCINVSELTRKGGGQDVAVGCGDQGATTATNLKLMIEGLDDRRSKLRGLRLASGEHCQTSPHSCSRRAVFATLGAKVHGASLCTQCCFRGQTGAQQCDFTVVIQFCSAISRFGNAVSQR
eukprot:1726355-Rhodomonas_salina.1